MGIMAAYVRAYVDRCGVLHCGRCGSDDGWIDTPTDVGCADCGALLPHSQHALFYVEV